MKSTKCIVLPESQDVMIVCPTNECHGWEMTGIDEPRKNFKAMELIAWESPEQRNGNEVSIHKCCKCNEVFKVEWDYENTELAIPVNK